MKVRAGFVSNSSSSCFIIALSRVPETQKGLQKLFFGDEETYPHPYPSDGVKSYTCKEVAEVLWNDLKGSITPNKVREAVAAGWIDGMPETEWDHLDDTQENQDKYWKDLDARQDAYAHIQADQFMTNHPNCSFFEFEYGDDTPMGSAMEHGNLFDRVPCFRISHH